MKGPTRSIGELCSYLVLATVVAGAAPPRVDAGTPRPPPPNLPGPVDDPLEVLYRPALTLDASGAPEITVLVMRGQSRVRVRAVGSAMVVRPRTEVGGPSQALHLPAGAWLTLEHRGLRAGELRRYPVVSEHRPEESAAVEASVRQWQAAGETVRVEEVGSVFGLGGRVVDNRRTLVVLDGPGDPGWARQAGARVESELGHAPLMHERLVQRPSAEVVLRDAAGLELGAGRSLASLEAEGGGHLEVAEVEHGVGYRWHGRETRTYPGSVQVVVDPEGLSVVNALPLEELLRGVVPAETYASAHGEALRAQAVTARGEILAKVGTRHLGEAALLCAEQHCQVFKGRGAAVATTDAAVRDTRGRVLVDGEGRLVDAVYSAVCGGHTENNEVVWGGAARATLRGRADFRPDGPWRRFSAGVGAADLERWLEGSPPAWCRLSSFRNDSKFRWEKRISKAEIDRMTSRLGVGSVRALEVIGRGVSGRVKGVKVVGDRRTAVVHRELPVRRLFGNLNSGMFVVRVETDAAGRPTAFVFRGGGWGHGVGMCQVGAIGMAEHGHDHQAILRHYYNGAEVVPIY